MSYQEFIQSIKESRPNEYFQYSERHHIIPHCLGGTNEEENLIYLTYQEHFIAHKLLSDENPENFKLFSAYWRMCNGKVKIATPEEYEEARKEFSDWNRIRMKGNSYTLGKKLPEFSQAHRDKISTGLKGKKHTEEHNKNFAIARTGKLHTEETKLRMSESRKGHPVSSEAKKKIADSNRETYYNLPSSQIAEMNRKNSQSHIGRRSIHKDNVEKCVLPTELEEYLLNGWIIGGLPRKMKGVI